MVVIYRTPKNVEAFDRHYFEIHVPLAKKIPGLRKYEVSDGRIATPYLRDPVLDLPMPKITPVTVQNAEHFQQGIREVIERLQGSLKPDQQLLVDYANSFVLV
jgi:uncharacterized protein (TIGR02118 family)